MVLDIKSHSLGQMGGPPSTRLVGRVVVRREKERAGYKNRPRRGSPSSPGPVGLEESREVDDQRQNHCEGPEHQGGEELGHDGALWGRSSGGRQPSMREGPAPARPPLPSPSRLASSPPAQSQSRPGSPEAAWWAWPFSPAFLSRGLPGWRQAKADTLRSSDIPKGNRPSMLRSLEWYP